MWRIIGDGTTFEFYESSEVTYILKFLNYEQQRYFLLIQNKLEPVQTYRENIKIEG